jgi:hypothetical protein
MLNAKALDIELELVRLARRDAEAAGCEVEALIRQVQQFAPGRQRLLFLVDCGEADDPTAAERVN